MRIPRLQTQQGKDITKLLYIALAPIQNPKPYRLMHAVMNIEQTVLYLKSSSHNLEGVEYANKDAFNHPTLDGYNAEIAKSSRLARRSGLLTGLTFETWQFARKHDIIVIYGHHLVAFWFGILAAKIYRKRLILTTDATSDRGSSVTSSWKSRIKPMFLRLLYNYLADAVYVPSTASKKYLETIGIALKRIVLTPYTVDEDLIESVSKSTDILSLRTRLGIPCDHTVFIFCAKFIPRKRPQDVIIAFSKLKSQNTTLLMVGSGPLEDDLRNLTTNLNMDSRIIFTGLVKYTKLPSYYTCADVLVFSSEHEPYGLPVNEMMLCGRPVIVSDQIGARLDLVAENETGWTYPVGDVKKLTCLMEWAAFNPICIKKGGENAQKKMKNWASQANVKAQLDYFEEQGWLLS